RAGTAGLGSIAAGPLQASPRGVAGPVCSLCGGGAVFAVLAPLGLEHLVGERWSTGTATTRSCAGRWSACGRPGGFSQSSPAPFGLNYVTILRIELPRPECPEIGVLDVADAARILGSDEHPTDLIDAALALGGLIHRAAVIARSQQFID